jgi:hypothetical protein
MSSPSTPSRLLPLLREPLLHFIVLGGVVFAGDQSLRARRPEVREIVVGPEVEREARNLFRTAQGREPSEREVSIMRERWVDNEVLYREGMAMRLEQGDATLRERVIFKAINVIESNLRLPEADESELRAYFQAHREKYEDQARYDFSEAVPSDSGDAALRRFAAALNGGAQVDIQSGLRIFQGRPRNTVVDAFGPEFVTALDQMPLNEWQVLASSSGLRVVRIESRTPGETVSFEDVRHAVLLDWRDSKAAELRTAAVRELGKKYTVRIAGSSS